MSLRFANQSRPPRSSHESLDRILSRTTLRTQRVTHFDVLDVGDVVLKRHTINVDAIRKEAAAKAHAAAELKHSAELQAALEKQFQELNDEKEKIVGQLKKRLDESNKILTRQRAESERRIMILQKQTTIDMERRLKEQAEEMTAKREEEIETATQTLRTQLRNEFALEREKAIAESLSKARDSFKNREKGTIARLNEEWEKRKFEESKASMLKHEEETKKGRERYNRLRTKYQRDLERRKQTESDFMELQADYQRFIDLTDGRFNSGYMMQLRDYDKNKTEKKISDLVTDRSPTSSHSDTRT